jgi:hypothetical protein
MAQQRSPDGRFLPASGEPLPPRRPRGLRGRKNITDRIRVRLTPDEVTLLENLIEAAYYESTGMERKKYANIIRKLNGENKGGL